MRKVTLQQANKLLIATRSSTKAEGTTLPPVNGVQKHLDPAVKPEHDKPVWVCISGAPSALGNWGKFISFGVLTMV